MRVASRKHMRTHPNRREVWAGSRFVYLDSSLQLHGFGQRIAFLFIGFDLFLSIYDACVDAFVLLWNLQRTRLYKNAAISLFL